MQDFFRLLSKVRSIFEITLLIENKMYCTFTRQCCLSCSFHCLFLILCFGGLQWLRWERSHLRKWPHQFSLRPLPGTSPSTVLLKGNDRCIGSLTWNKIAMTEMTAYCSLQSPCLTNLFSTWKRSVKKKIFECVMAKQKLTITILTFKDWFKTPTRSRVKRTFSPVLSSDLCRHTVHIQLTLTTTD